MKCDMAPRHLEGVTVPPLLSLLTSIQGHDFLLNRVHEEDER